MEIQNTSPSPMIDADQAALCMGVQKATLAVWRCTGRYKLPFVRVGRRVMYRVSDIEAWLQERTVTQATESGAA